MLALAGLYAVALGAAVLAGDHAPWQGSDPQLGELARWDRPRRPHNALDLGAFGPASGILCLVVGAGLLARQGWARHALHVAAPCGALALAGTYPQRLWTQDVPKTVLLGLAFGVLALLVSRGGAIAAATSRSAGTRATGTWVRRCVPIALGMLGLAFGAYLYVKSSKPRPFGMRVSMNEYVQVLVVTHLFLWHAVPGLIGAAVRFLRRGAGSPPAA